MEVLERVFKCPSRSSIFKLYPIGDTHIGCRNCCESRIRELVQTIGLDENSYWIGGGDLIDAINPSDVRFDMDTLPDWMLEGDAHTTRERLNDIIRQQRDRVMKILGPIKHRCLGLIEGNHEYTIRKRYHRKIHDEICFKMDVPNLSDRAHIRLTFKRAQAGMTTQIAIRHGYGGGRSDGAEPNKLGKFMDEIEADFYFTGHTHTAGIIRKPILYMPKSGVMPYEYCQKVRWAGNWGSCVKSAARGPSSYDSRACYPPRNLGGIVATIQPFHQVRKPSVRDRKKTQCGVKAWEQPLLKIDYID